MVSSDPVTSMLSVAFIATSRGLVSGRNYVPRKYPGTPEVRLYRLDRQLQHHLTYRVRVLFILYGYVRNQFSTTIQISNYENFEMSMGSSKVAKYNFVGGIEFYPGAGHYAALVMINGTLHKCDDDLVLLSS